MNDRLKIASRVLEGMYANPFWDDSFASTLAETALEQADILIEADAKSRLNELPPDLPAIPEENTLENWLETIPCPKWRAAAISRIPAERPYSIITSLANAVFEVDWVDYNRNWTNKSKATWYNFAHCLKHGTRFHACPYGTIEHSFPNPL
jgi:hypothetical protein